MYKGLSFSLLILLLPVSYRFFSHGLFFDGLTYASISRNLAEGVGTFFKPVYTLTLGNPSYGHLPMAFWFSSVFFKIFGDHPLLERYISVSLGVISLVLLYLWAKSISKTRWIWIGFLILSPILPWAISNYILEVFILLWTSISLLILNHSFKGPIFPFLGGFFLFLSFMTKGPVGLFVTVYPAVYGFLHKVEIKKILKAYIFLILGFFLPLLFLLSFEDFRIYLWKFLDGQVFAGIVGKREITPSRFYILARLAIEISPLIFLLILRLSFMRSVMLTNGFWLSLVLAISSSFPFVISLKQMPFYIVPSLPFFALAFSELGGFWEIEERLEKFKYFPAIIFTLLILNLLLIFASKNRILSRNPFYIDFALNPPKIEKVHRKVGVCPDFLYSDWETVAIAQRYLKLSFVPGWMEYTVVDIKNCKIIPQNCVKIHPKNPKRFALFFCRN